MMKRSFWRRSSNLVAVRKNSGNDGLSSIVRKACIMENTQPTKTENESESKAAISDASIKSKLVAATDKEGSTSSPQNTTATTPNGSTRIWTNAELAELRSKAGLVAGALRDFQDAKGIVVTTNVPYTLASGRKLVAVKVFMIVEDMNLVADKTADGLDFNIVAVNDEKA